MYLNSYSFSWWIELWLSFYHKELAEEFNNTEKYITFTVPIEKEVASIDKNGEEITKKHLTYYNLLVARNFWQAYYQVLPIIASLMKS